MTKKITRSRKGIIARNPLSEPAVLQEIFDIDDGALCYSLARNPSTPSDVLKALMRGKDERLGNLAAAHPTWTTESLKKLCKGERTALSIALSSRLTLFDIALSRNLSAHSYALSGNLNAELTDVLSVHPKKTVRSAVARRPFCSDEVLERLLNDEEISVVASALSNPSIREEALSRFISSDSREILFVVASNKNTPDRLLGELITKGLGEEYKTLRGYLTAASTSLYDSWLVEAVSLNPNLSLKNQKRLLVHEDENVRGGLARNPALHKSLAPDLTKDQSSTVRQFLAQNRNLPTALFYELACDADYSVRADVARNPECPPDLLQTLSADGKVDVRRSVANAQHANPETLVTLCQDKNRDVRMEAVSNPTFPKSEMQLVLDSDIPKWVQINFLIDNKFDSEMIAKELESANSDLRMEAASNKNIDYANLVALADDKNYKVVCAVLWNPNCDIELQKFIHDKHGVA